MEAFRSSEVGSGVNFGGGSLVHSLYRRPTRRALVYEGRSLEAAEERPLVGWRGSVWAGLADDGRVEGRRGGERVEGGH